MTTLLDGGAPHCLRKTRGGDEWPRAQPVTVKLATRAGSSTETMQRDWNVADNGASASHRTSEQDVASRLQHDVDQG